MTNPVIVVLRKKKKNNKNPTPFSRAVLSNTYLLQVCCY